MSFEDWDYVEIDDESGIFTIVMNSGQTREYKIRNQPELYDIILDGYRNNEITIYDVETGFSNENDFDDTWNNTGFEEDDWRW